MNQKHDLLFTFFIKAVNKSKAYSFLIIGMMNLQNNTVKTVLCDSSRDERNKITKDSKSLNTGSIHINTIA